MAAPDQKPSEENALTSIPRRIHCAATPEDPPGHNEQDEDFVDELDEIEINNFINALAEVTMAVAARRLAKNKDAA